MASSKMDDYCGSTFWDSNLTWHTTDPDFTECFERTVLVWVPCIFLWTFSSLEVYYILNSKKRDIPWNWLNIAKVLITSILIFLTLADLSLYVYVSVWESVPGVFFYTPLIKIISFVMVCGCGYGISERNKKRKKCQYQDKIFSPLNQ